MIGLRKVGHFPHFDKDSQTNLTNVVNLLHKVIRLSLDSADAAQLLHELNRDPKNHEKRRGLAHALLGEATKEQKAQWAIPERDINAKPHEVSIKVQ